MLDSADQETKVLLARVSTKLDIVGDEMGGIKQSITESRISGDKRAETLSRKLDDMHDQAHETSMILQAVKIQQSSHEELDSSRFNRLWWVIGVGTTFLGGALLKVFFR